MKQNKAWLFFSLTILISYALWFTPAIIGLNSIISYILFILGGIIPSTLGIIMVYKKGNKQDQHNFWKRVINFKIIKKEWYLFIFLFMPIINILAMYINYLINDTRINFSPLISYFQHPLSLLALIGYILFIGPIVEELGWRGLAIEELNKKYDILKTSIIISIFWALWHIPLFFINKTEQYNLVQDSVIYGIDFMLIFLPASIIMGYIYQYNNKSILSAILFHYMINFSGRLFNIPHEACIYRTLLLYMGAAILVLIANKKQ